MNRFAASFCVLACALIIPGAALGASPRTATVTGSSTGTVTYLDGSSLTIQTAGPSVGLINAMVRTANRVTQQDYPYVYGGGHAQAGIASIGIKGPGYTGHTRGYDCSGSVAAVLAGAGLWPAGGGVPNDAGIIAQLQSEHLIAKGTGTGPAEVTLYDDPGVHIFMNIDGRFFGTSDGGGGGDRKGGAGWLNDGAPDASTRIYHPYHLLPSVLKQKTSYGSPVTFTLAESGAADANLQVGDAVHVSYEEARSGSLTATEITFVGATTASGTVQSIASGASSFVIQTAGGQSLTLDTGTATALVDQLQVGDTVSVTYTTQSGTLEVHAVTVTAQAQAAAGTTTGVPTTGTPATGTPATGTPGYGTTGTGSGSPTDSGYNYSGGWNGSGSGGWGGGGR